MRLIWNYSGFKSFVKKNLATKFFFQFAILIIGIYSLKRVRGDTVSGTVIETKEFNKTNLVNAYNFVAEVSAQEYFIETTDQQGGNYANRILYRTGVCSCQLLKPFTLKW
jgi:hypothetical protein